MDFVGFIEYDLQLEKNTTKFIENNLKGEISILLSTRHRLKKLLTQTDISIDGKSCIPIIINDYNLFLEQIILLKVQ